MAGIGFLFFALKGLLNFVGDVKEDRENELNRKYRVNPDGLTYIDYHGDTRLVSNDHKAMYSVYSSITRHYPCMNGDYILEDIDTHRLVHNFGNKQREIELAHYRKNLERLEKEFEGKSVYCVDDTVNKKNHPYGLRVIDRETGKKLVVNRYLPNTTKEVPRLFLVDADTWLIVREFENYDLECNGPYKYKRERIPIEEINKRILEYKEKDLQYLAPGYPFEIRFIK